MPLGPTGESALVKCEAEGGIGRTPLRHPTGLGPEARAAFNLRYASLLGSLGWLANSTRPDIAFAASAAGRHTKAPYSRHLKALEHVLNYVIHTSDKGLVYDSSNCRFQMRLSAFSDADFATDEETRLSRTGAILFINNGPVYWTSHLQKVVSISTTASELLAAHEAMQQVRIIGENLEAQGFHSKYTHDRQHHRHTDHHGRQIRRPRGREAPRGEDQAACRGEGCEVQGHLARVLQHQQPSG